MELRQPPRWNTLLDCAGWFTILKLLSSVLLSQNNIPHYSSVYSVIFQGPFLAQSPRWDRLICLNFGVNRDSRVLVAGGRSRFVHVWSLESKQLLRVVELPKKVTSVSQLEFLPDSFDAGSNQVSVQPWSRINQVSVQPGRRIIGVCLDERVATDGITFCLTQPLSVVKQIPFFLRLLVRA